MAMQTPSDDPPRQTGRVSVCTESATAPYPATHADIPPWVAGWDTAAAGQSET